METEKIIISSVLLLLAIPIGIMLKRFTKEEIRYGRIYFFFLWIICIFLSIIIYLINIDKHIKLSAIFSLIFVLIVSFISWNKKIK
ncbi:MAG: hypothetical protein QXJ28_01855 [Candidatus Pacearchaeota archaeon]